MITLVFLVAFATCVIVATFFFPFRTARNLNQNLANLSVQYGGRVDKGTIWTNPILQFRSNGVPVTLDFVSHHKTLNTRFTTEWRKPSLVCKIQKSSFVVNWSNRLLFRRAVTTGDLQFDNQFFVSGNNADEIRGLLAPSVRYWLSRFRIAHPYSGYRRAAFEIECGELAIMVEGRLEDEGILRQFIEMSLQLSDAMRGATGEGIRFVEFDRESIISNVGRCPICGEPQADRATVQCSLCRTPHHRDCWLYTGRCSVYGCAGNTFVERANRRANVETLVASHTRR